MIKPRCFEPKSIIGPKAKRCPNGMTIKVRSGWEPSSSFDIYTCDEWVHLYELALVIDNDYQVGELTLVKIGPGTYETHCNIKQEYRGQGLGILLHTRAADLCIRKGFKVFSSLCPSKFASRTWKSKRLNNLFRIVKLKNRFMVLGRK